MIVSFREAMRQDVPEIVAMLADDVLGQARETTELAPYFAAFDVMQSEASNTVIVAESENQLVATYQLTFISGLSLRAARRAQIESVRVHEAFRGKGLGSRILADAEARAIAAGCSLLQLTSNRSRSDALRFYESGGFTPSHIGFKRVLPTEEDR